MIATKTEYMDERRIICAWKRKACILFAKSSRNLILCHNSTVQQNISLSWNNSMQCDSEWKSRLPKWCIRALNFNPQKCALGVLLQIFWSWCYNILGYYWGRGIMICLCNECRNATKYFYAFGTTVDEFSTLPIINNVYLIICSYFNRFDRPHEYFIDYRFWTVFIFL